MLSSLSPSDPAVKKEFATFKTEVTKEATLILSDRMPQKILYFNKLVSEKAATDGSVVDAAAAQVNPWLRFIPDQLPPLVGAATSNDDATAVSPPSDVKAGDENATTALASNKRLKVSASEWQSMSRDQKDAIIIPSRFPAHPQIFRMTEEIKKEVSELIEMAGAVKLFIQLNVPRIEGGNNFGVQIQEEAIQELARVEDAAFSVCSAIVEYFSSRATLATKIIKYPNVQDYKEALRELDEKKWMLLKVTRIDMRNNYAMLYDLLSKNWERVVKPRHSDGTSMIY